MRAVRVTKGAKQTVQILDDDGAVIEEAGGNRAARANAAVVSCYRGRIKVELRADVAAAEGLAALHLKDTMSYRSGGRTVEIPCTPAEWAQALLIEG